MPTGKQPSNLPSPSASQRHPEGLGRVARIPFGHKSPRQMSQRRPSRSQFEVVRRHDPSPLLNLIDWTRDILSFPFVMLYRLMTIRLTIRWPARPKVQRPAMAPRPQAPKPTPYAVERPRTFSTFARKTLDLRQSSDRPAALRPPSLHSIYPNTAGGSRLSADLSAAPPPRTAATRTRAGNHSFPRLFLNRALMSGAVLTLAILLAIGSLLYQTSLNLYRGVYAEALTGQDHLRLAQEAISAQEFDTAREEFLKAQTSLEAALSELQKDSIVQSVPIISGRLTTGERIIESALHIAEGGYTLTSALSPMTDILKGKNSSQVTDQSSMADYTSQIMTVLSISRPQLKLALDDFDAARTLLDAINPSDLDTSTRAQVAEGQAKIATLRDIISQVYDLASVLPDILGHNGARHYLILFQNNSELRPTGGFIGSYAILTFADGKFENLFTDNVYNPDGQIQVQGLCKLPPKPLQKLTQCWGMRDANWSPDFPTSAQQVMSLYETGSGNNVDGMIGITPEVVRDLLALTGPVYLPQWNEVVTADNVVSLIQYKVTVEFAADQDPKRFLIDLSQVVLDRVLHLNRADWTKAFDILKSNLAQKDIQLYMENPQAQLLLSRNSWSGEVQSSTADYLMVNTANLSATKASQFIVPRYRLITTIATDGTITDKLTITYQHTGSWEWPSDHVINYQRIYIPKGSTLIEATTAEQTEGKLSITEVYEELGKTVLSDTIRIVPSSSLMLSYTYTLPFKISTAEGAAYTSVIQKQAGTGEIPLEREIDYDSFTLEPLQSSPDLIFKEPGIIEGTYLLTTDMSERIIFVPHTIL